MKIGIEQILIDALRGSVNIIFYAGRSQQAHFIKQLINSCPIFSLYTVNDIQQYSDVVRQLRKIHVFVVQDENQQDPYLYVSRLNRMEMASAGTLSDFDVSPIHLATENVPFILQRIQRCAIESSLVSTTQDPEAQNAIDRLFEKNPTGVNEWAEISEMKIRKFQRKWKIISTLSPKKVLALYHAYRIAFSQCAGDSPHKFVDSVQYSHKINEADQRRILEYVLMRKSSLLSKEGPSTRIS